MPIIYGKKLSNKFTTIFIQIINDKYIIAKTHFNFILEF